MNKAKISSKIVSRLNKNAVEIEKISPALPEKSVCISKVKSVLKTPDTVQNKKSLVWKEPVVLSDKDLTNTAVESSRNVQRPVVILLDDSSSSRNISTKEYLLKRQDSNKTPIKVINISKQKECQDIKVLPNVSNSSKLISEKKFFDASEKIPPVSTKIIYVGNASQTPVIKQAIAASNDVNSSSEQILHNASKINKGHTLQMKHLSIKKTSRGKQTVQMNPNKVTSTEKIIVNLSEGRSVLRTEAKPNLMNFLESSSSIQNKQSNNIEGNKQMIILPIKSISEVTSHNLQLPSFQNSGIELHAVQCNIGKNVSLKSNSPVQIYSPEQISTLNRAVNTQPFKLIKKGSSMSSSVNKPTSADSQSFMPCSISSLKKDITCSRKSTKETENEYPPVNLSVVHMESKPCLIYRLKKNPETGIKSNVIKTNNDNSSIQIISPTTNVISSVNQKSKHNFCETENTSSVPKSNSSIMKKTLMPIEVSSTKQGKDNSCKQRNKKSALEIVSCAAETSSVSSTTICSSNMNEIDFGKNNRYKTRSKNAYRLAQQKNQFVLANKVANFTSLPKFTPAILLPKVLLKKLPDAVTEACIKKGYFLVRKLPKISVSSTIGDPDIGEKRNKALKRKLVKCPVSTNPKVQVRSTKCDELNDSKEGASRAQSILNENVLKHAAFSEEKNASLLTKKDEMAIQSVLPAFKKGVWQSNLKIIKVSAKEMEKLNDCFKNPCVTVPPTASKQQTLPIPILVNKDAVKKKTETINEPKSASMHHKTPMKQVFEKKEDRKWLSSDLLKLRESEKQKKVEKDKIKKKEKILKKMLLKYEEKEEKKRWKYLQKRLIRCIEKNKNRLKRRTGLLMEIVTTSSKLKEQIHKLNCTENDDIKHLLTKLVKAIRDNDSFVAISKNHKEVAKSQSVQGEKTVNKDEVQNSVNMSTSKIQRNHKSQARVGKRKKSISKSTSMNIFSSSVSQDNVYRYDPASERSREDTISFSKLNESQEKMSPKKDISYKLQRKSPKKSYADDPYVDLSIITDEKYTIECVCESKDCDGIHPEFLQFP